MPPGGLGAKLTSIHEFHRERGLDIRNGCYERRDDQDFVRDVSRIAPTPKHSKQCSPCFS
jgi:hypothetical protein